MSWELPERPSLEHLRKQAKALPDDLRKSDPNARLADALHQVARRFVLSRLIRPGRLPLG